MKGNVLELDIGAKLDTRPRQARPGQARPGQARPGQAAPLDGRLEQKYFFVNNILSHPIFHPFFILFFRAQKDKV